MQDLSYNRFIQQPMEEDPKEEQFALDWEHLLSKHEGADWELLRDMCVELSFPVREGMSEDPQFLEALKRGVLPEASQGAWVPENPDGVHVYLHQTSVGRLPVIECENDADFIRLQQSLVYRGEPKPVPDSRGATIIKNYNNWARVNMHRGSGDAKGGAKGGAGKIPADPALYRDFIMLLSHRFYSGVAPEAFSLTKAVWAWKSFILRREHEAAHYMTQRYYHSVKNEIHDEIIADFMGLTAAFEGYDAEKFLTFMGLEDPHKYRKGGRLEIYLGDTPPEGDDFKKLCDTVRRAAVNIEKHCGEKFQMLKNSRFEPMDIFHTLCRTSVADMAAGNFAA